MSKTFTEAKQKFPSDKEIIAYMDQIANPESGGSYSAKNPLPGQTATGRYQITVDTWKGMINNIKSGYYKNYGIDQKLLNQLSKMPHNKMFDAKAFPNYKQLQDTAALLLGKHNAIALRDKKIPVNVGSMYVMHGLGTGLGARVLSNPNISIEQAYKDEYGKDWEWRYKAASENNPGFFKDLDATSKTNQLASNISAKVGHDMSAVVSAEPAQVDTPGQSVLDKATGTVSDYWKQFKDYVTTKRFDPADVEKIEKAVDQANKNDPGRTGIIDANKKLIQKGIDAVKGVNQAADDAIDAAAGPAPEPQEPTVSAQPRKISPEEEAEFEIDAQGKTKWDREMDKQMKQQDTKEGLKESFGKYMNRLEITMKSKEFLGEAGAFDTSAMAKAQTSANKVAVQNKPAPTKTGYFSAPAGVTMGQGLKPTVSAQPKAQPANKFDSKSSGAVAAFGAKTGPASTAKPATQTASSGAGMFDPSKNYIQSKPAAPKQASAKQTAGIGFGMQNTGKKPAQQVGMFDPSKNYVEEGDFDNISDKIKGDYAKQADKIKGDYSDFASKIKGSVKKVKPVPMPNAEFPDLEIGGKKLKPVPMPSPKPDFPGLGKKPDYKPMPGTPPKFPGLGKKPDAVPMKKDLDINFLEDIKKLSGLDKK